MGAEGTVTVTCDCKCHGLLSKWIYVEIKGPDDIREQAESQDWECDAGQFYCPECRDCR